MYIHINMFKNTYDIASKCEKPNVLSLLLIKSYFAYNCNFDINIKTMFA